MIIDEPLCIYVSVGTTNALEALYMNAKKNFNV